ncbi:hypothetical protein SAMN05216369_2828 [Marinobacter antarcticus]|uniref:Uncharacterized protein n=1 Tax=Marinobacter antarcticus TaxID=564117 RepID=A0A1M6UH92_9GAMM|nr:hypothetical protein [Marinobacter antarcticus]SHK68537.1 hypothetical protein SAMN05216369_2828 [Marinobacter antarcticus]
MKPSYTSKETLNRAQASAARFFDGSYGPFIDRVHPELKLKVQEQRAAREAEVSQRRAEANRLVKASKSPTDRFPGSTGAYFNRPAPRRKPVPIQLEMAKPGYAHNLDQAGTWTVIEYRKWADEYRIRMDTRPGAGAQTPDNAGDRVTAMLTERGARKISESCYYMACQRGGFSTFATLTLSQEAREKLGRRIMVPMFPANESGFPVIPLESARAKQGPLGVRYDLESETPRYNVAEINYQAGEIRHEKSGALYTPLKMGWKWSVQKEASRFFEAANKMYQRGWQYQNDQGEAVKVAGSRKCVAKKRPASKGDQFDAVATPIKFEPEPLAYLWVAENPDRIDTETGEYMGENPHLHIMMKWRVDHRHFEAWAARLEKLWGHGFAHLEKIKDPQKAGSYVAKAAGYLSKAQGKTDQGDIRGNRYGISARARAPGWIECERHQVGLMGWLLAEAHEKWNTKHGPKIARRDYLKKKLTGDISVRAGKVVQILAAQPHERKAIGNALEKVRRAIEALPRVSKYGAVFKSQEQLDRFMTWAHRQGWSERPQESLWLKQWRHNQLFRRNRSRLNASAEDFAAWYQQADSGEFALEGDYRGWEPADE